MPTFNLLLTGEHISADIHTQHILNYHNFVVKTENKYNEKRKIVNIFQNSKWEQEYAIEINNRFEILENMEDEDNNDNNINEKWGNIKTIINETKQQLIEQDKSTETLQNRWYDEECKIAIEKRTKQEKRG